MSDIHGISIILACDSRGGIGKDGKLPWHIPEDLKRFKDLTQGATIIMGRKTYDEIADKFPDRTDAILPGRKSIVLSRKMEINPRGASVKPRLRTAIEDARNSGEKSIFVIGGERLFWEALPWANMVFMTAVDGDYHCDKHFPLKSFISKGKWHLKHATKREGYTFIDYIRICH